MARVDRDRRYISWRGMALGAALLLILFFTALFWVRSELARVGSEGYVENAAREEYGFIKQGEIVFAFENPDALKGYTEEEYQIIMDEMRD